jgi:uncharacterized protein with HEPN domain
MSNKKSKLSPLQTIAFARLWIARILTWTASDTYESFSGNEERQAAVYRAFTALGEALKNIPREMLNQEPGIPWEDAFGFRDIIAHDYFEDVEERTTWMTIKDDLVPLDAALARMEGRLKQR